MENIAQTYSEHRRAILRLGGPLIASHMAQFAIHMTDTIMLGWYDVAALAAATIATTMFFVTFIVGSGFAFAVTPMVAAAAEEGDEVQVIPRGTGTHGDYPLGDNRDSAAERAYQLCLDFRQFWRARNGYPRRGGGIFYRYTGHHVHFVRLWLAQIAAV